MYQQLRETDLGMKGFHEQQSAKEKLRSETTLCSDMMQGIACINSFSFAGVQLSLSPSNCTSRKRPPVAVSITNEEGLAVDRMKSWGGTVGRPG